MESSDNIKLIFQRYLELKYHWELINEKTHNIVECQREYRYTDSKWDKLDMERFELYKQQKVISETMLSIECELKDNGWKYYWGKLVPCEKSDNI